VITILDRMFLLSYFRSYAIVWTSLIGLYIVLDLFTHLDDFVNKPGGFVASANLIVKYYGYRIPQLFDLMAEPITLMAAAFSVSWMQRNNELLPQLSAGIPTRRAIRPILLGSALTLSLGPLNQEFLIPEVADELMTTRDDPEGAKAQLLMGAYDSPTGIHLEGFAGFRRDRKVDRLNITFPENSPSGMIHMTAAEGVYVPPGDGPLTGGWMLTRTNPDSFDGPLPTNITALGTGRFFLKVQDADFDAVCRGGTWYIYAPTTKLREMLADPEPRRRGKMAVLFHTRMTRPLVGSIMVVLGLSVILFNPNRHVIISAGLCMGLSAALNLFVIACKYLGDQDVLPAPLAAWLPVMLFGPIALVAFDSVHT
jgi:lipopolysaccharide export system permease protein